MKLLEMHKPLVQMTPVEREQFIRSYRSQREKDLSTAVLRRCGPLLSKEERALLKKVGIKLSDLVSLKGG